MKRYHAHVDSANRNLLVPGWEYARYDGEARCIAGHYMGNTPRHWRAGSGDPKPSKHTDVGSLLLGDFEGGVRHVEQVRRDAARHWPTGRSGPLRGFDAARDLLLFDEEILHPDPSVCMAFNAFGDAQRQAAEGGGPDAVRHANLTTTLLIQAAKVYEGVYSGGRGARGLWRRAFGPRLRMASWGLLRDRGSAPGARDQVAVAAAWTPALPVFNAGCAALYWTGDERADAAAVALERRKIALLQPGAEALACVDPTRYGAIDDTAWHLSLIRDAGFAGVIEWAQRPGVAVLSRFDQAINIVNSRFAVDRAAVRRGVNQTNGVNT